MDIVFNCPDCGQQLEVDAAAAGSQIECPACSNQISIPVSGAAEPVLQIAPAPPAVANAEARMERHFAVPQHKKEAEALIQKPAAPLATAAKEAENKPLRIKTIKRGDCQEVGKDKFDQTVTDFLSKIGESNIVSMHPVSYTHVDIESRPVTDFGLMVIYRG